MSGRGLVAAAAVVLALGALGGCAVHPVGGPRIVVDRFGNGVADPVAISVTGLRPGESVVLRAEAKTATGTLTSRAVYAVPPDGRVELWTQQPVTAPYVRPDGAALLWSMTGTPLAQSDLERTWALGGVTIRIDAEQQGRPVASTELRRSPLAAQSVERAIHVSDLMSGGGAKGATGSMLAGRLFTPLPTLVHPRPAVIVVDGDEGGSSGAFAARRIAALGFPVFVLPAFGPAGQIPGSAALSVEAFDVARDWLAARPGVNPGRIVVYGTGAAAPLALWLAAEEPGRVYTAIAASGPTALLCTSAAGTPLLIDRGQPVPCESPDQPVAETPLLPLSDIIGPILLACGGGDQTLPSACEWMRAGVAARGPRGADELLAAPGAAHDIATPPLLPIGLDDLPPATAQATEDARVAFWSRVTDLLERVVEP